MEKFLEELSRFSTTHFFPFTDLHQIAPHENDTRVLLTALSNASDPIAVMNSIEGPYAFVFYQAESRTIWFGRVSDHNVVES